MIRGTELRACSDDIKIRNQGIRMSRVEPQFRLPTKPGNA
jgi:hypothetical protein